MMRCRRPKKADVNDGATPAKRDGNGAELATEETGNYRAENVVLASKSRLQPNAKRAAIGKLINAAMLAIDANNTSPKRVLSKDSTRPALDKIALVQW